MVKSIANVWGVGSYFSLVWLWKQKITVGGVDFCSLLQLCAKHTQHAEHAVARGSGGMPLRKFLKKRCSEIASENIFAKSKLLLHLMCLRAYLSTWPYSFQTVNN